MKHSFRISGMAGAILLTLTALAEAQAPRPPRPAAPPAPAPPAVYTSVSGSIAQFNYNRDAMIEGFLLSDKTLVHLPPNAASTIAPALHTSDAVEVSGMAATNANGARTIEVQQLKDKSTGKTFAVPQPGPAAPYSGSGHIQQLNYGADGSVNGFLLDNGTLAELPPFSAANPSSIRTGAAVIFTGYARNTVTGRTVVNVQTISLNGQTLTLAAAGPGRGPDAQPPAPPVPPQDGRGARARATAPPPPPVPNAPASNRPAAAAGDGRSEEPPPPPAPPAGAPTPAPQR